MLSTRVIPTLLLRGDGLVKTVQFKAPKYVGDPINAVKIFNEKEVDELCFLDIGATPAGKEPNFELLTRIASQAFMPLAYGGGVSSMSQILKLLTIGFEKVVLNTSAADSPELIRSAADEAGSQSVVVSMDVKRKWNGRYTVMVESGAKDIKADPVEYAKRAEDAGAGEVYLNSIDRDGVMGGYDLKLIESVSSAVSVPVVAAGGAGVLSHFRDAVDSGATAVSAGSMFVFYGKHRAVLITYPEYRELVRLFK